MPLPELAETALDQYDLAPPVRLFSLSAQGNTNAVIGVRTGAGDFVLKVHAGSDNSRRPEWEHAMLAWLQGQGLSFGVPAPIRTQTGAWIARSALGWQSLAPLFPGTRVDPTDERELEAFGAALGELLVAFARVPLAIAPLPGSEFHLVVPRLPELMLDVAALGLDDTRHNRELLTWLDAERADLRQFMESEYQTLPKQLTHNDFIPGNVLVQAGRVTAVLDFEFATHGVRGLDFAKALLFSLRYGKDPDPRWTATVLSRGYARTNSLTAPEIQLLPRLLRLRKMASTLGWLGRAVRSGTGRGELWRIEETRAFAAWLARWESVLVAAVASELS